MGLYKAIFGLLCCLWTVPLYGDNIDVIKNASVQVECGPASGSGTLISRDITVDGKPVKFNFVITAYHILEGQRTSAVTIDHGRVLVYEKVYIIPDDKSSKVTCQIFKVSKLKDIAILIIDAEDSQYDGIGIKLDMLKQGDPVLYCGAPFGSEIDALVSGMLSKHGKDSERENGGPVTDMLQLPVAPGASGGGVFTSGDDPKFVGMIVKLSTCAFSLMVPVREMVEWAKDNEIQWIFNTDSKPPSLEDLVKIPIGDKK